MLEERQYVEAGLRSHIAALEAERDELRRRLDAVVRECRDTAELKCYCEFDRDHERTMECEYCEEVTALRAIAEAGAGEQ
jgi:hypothetical protein